MEALGMKTTIISLSALLLVLLIGFACGTQEATPLPPRTPPDARGFVPVGKTRSVLFHPQRQIVEVEGTFNLQYGFLEYLACAPGIKPHETLIALDCHPVELKLGLILLGLEEEEVQRPASDVDLRAIPGDRAIILLRWKVQDEEGKEIVREERAENCIFNGLVSESMQKVGWVFTGSMFIEEEPPLPLIDDDRRDTEAKAAPPEKTSPPQKTFAPLLTGEFISVCHRPLTILDNPLALPFPDADYYANPEVLPPVKRDEPVPVTVIFRRPLEGEIDKKAVRMKIPPPPKKEGD